MQAELTGDLSDLDRDNLAKTAANMAVLVKARERLAAICDDIAKHLSVLLTRRGRLRRAMRTPPSSTIRA